MMESQPAAEDGFSAMQTQDTPQLLSFSLAFGGCSPQRGGSRQYLIRAGELLAHVCSPLARGEEELTNSYVHPP